MDASSHANHPSASLTRGTALTFVILLGIVSLFADMTYEGARSITGRYWMLTLIGYVVNLLAVPLLVPFRVSRRHEAV